MKRAGATVLVAPHVGSSWIVGKVRAHCAGFRDSVSCPVGKQLAPKATMIKCRAEQCSSVDEDTCCVSKSTCDDAACPFGYAHRHQIDDPYTSAIHCFEGLNGDCRDKCCFKSAMCDSFICPAGFDLGVPAALLNCGDTKCTKEQCCHLTPSCKTPNYEYPCPVGTILKHNASEVFSVGGYGFQATDCCAPAPICAHHICPRGQTLKANAPSLHCSSDTCCSKDDAICCEFKGTCGGYKCPVGMVLKSDPETHSCSGSLCGTDDVSTCCTNEAMCDTVVCPRRTAPVANAANVGCGSHACHDWKLCCEEVALCSSLMCPSVPVPYGAVPDEQTSDCNAFVCTATADRDTCCAEMKVCTAYSCATDFAHIAGAQNEYRNDWDKDECCVPRAHCDTYSCPVGFHPKHDGWELQCNGGTCSDADAAVCCECDNSTNSGSGTDSFHFVVTAADPEQGRCVQFAPGFWCDATGDQIGIVAHIFSGGSETTKDWGTHAVPSLNEDPKHVTWLLENTAIEPTRVSVWIVRKHPRPWTGWQAGMAPGPIRELDSRRLQGGSAEPRATVKQVIPTTDLWL